MSIQGNDGFLDLENASLRVTGNVHAEGLKVGSVRLQSAATLQSTTVSGNTTTQMVQFTNPTKGFDVTSNIEVGDANLYVDTTTGRVGVGTNAPMGTLDVKGVLNHTQVANVAQITSNSNVVMEYKLSTRDYEEVAEPRVAIDNTLSVGGYTVSASSTFNSGSTGTYGPWGAFNKLNDANGWSSDGHGGSTDTYSTSDGSQLLNVQHHTGSALGEWIQLDMPYGILLKSVDIQSRNESSRTTEEGFPKNVYLYGSTNNSTWSLIKNFTAPPKTQNKAEIHNEPVSVQVEYKHFALVTNNVYVGAANFPAVGIGEIRYYGTRLTANVPTGTDVVLHTIPNVPNTDFSNVYYDGQDYTSMPATVADKSGNGVTGTPSGGVGFDTTYKAFTFDGVDDKITTPALGFTGDQLHTFSLWIKLNNNNSEVTNDERLFRIGDSASTTATASGVGFNSSGHVNWYSRSHDTGFAFHTEANKWYHWVFVYSGVGAIGNNNSEGLRRSKKMYSDGIELEPQIGPGRGNTTALNFSASHNLMIGDDDQGGTPFSGSIANFRLYDHPLSADEIWELYAYQKAFFEGIPDVITFKGGRLGIGTTEPKAVLDVRGIAPTWKRANLLNGWVHYTSTQYNHPFPSYCKDLTGRVHLKGLVQNGSGTIFRLPPGYRPSNEHIFAVVSNNAFGRVDVKANGNVYFSVGGNSYVSLDTISFYCN